MWSRAVQSILENCGDFGRNWDSIPSLTSASSTRLESINSIMKRVIMNRGECLVLMLISYLKILESNRIAYRTVYMCNTPTPDHVNTWLSNIVQMHLNSFSFLTSTPYSYTHDFFHSSTPISSPLLMRRTDCVER